jgi:hypothetical protein
MYKKGKKELRLGIEIELFEEVKIKKEWFKKPHT